LKNEQRDHEEIHQGHRDRTRRAKENPRHPTESAAVTEHSRTTEIVAVSIEGDGRMSECEHPDCDLEGREFTYRGHHFLLCQDHFNEMMEIEQ
jgi:hypothetical protein